MWKRLRGKKRGAQGSDAPRDRTPAGRGDAPDPQSAPPVHPRRTGAGGVRASAEEHVDYTVDHGIGSADATLAPEQDEDRLPHQQIDDRPLSRADRVGAALDTWAGQVAGALDGPSFLTHMRAGAHVLDLTHSHPSGLAQLLAGRGPTRLSSLVREADSWADARVQARAIRDSAERQAEEIGLSTCHLGIGEATWDPDDDGRPLEAPVLVRPITLRLRGNTREDIELDLDSTVEVNPVLLRALRDAGIAIDARALLSTTDGAHGFDPTPVLDAFKALGQPLPGFRITHALVVGNLMDAAGHVVEDLHSDRADWIDQPLPAALAGDAGARGEVAPEGTELPGPDGLPEVEEADLVSAMEPDRVRALRHVLAGKDLALTTVPGTDPVDLVVDLAAELNARGRSVLVVSQRRRNLTELARLAEQRGLGDLLFDLSPDPSLQRNASSALLRSLRGAGSFRAPVDTEEPEELTEARRILTGHVEAMHRVQQPWQASAHDALSALAALTRLRPAPRTRVRLGSEVAATMIGSARERQVDALREAARHGMFDAGPEDSAWFGAPITSETQATKALELVVTMRDELAPAMRRAVRLTGPDIGLKEARTPHDLAARLRLLDRVRSLLSIFQPAVFGAELEDLIAVTADAQWRAQHGVTFGWTTRRRLRKQAAGLQRPASLAPDLHAALQDARKVRDDWRKADGGERSTPTVPKNFDALRRSLDRLEGVSDELAVLLEGTPAGGDLAATDIDDIEQRMDALIAGQDELQGLPVLTSLRRSLEADGLGPLVEDLRARRVREKDVAAELDLAWWQSVLELIAEAEPTISQYDGTSLSQVAERFRRLDAEHMQRASYRVRAACDDALVTKMKAFPDTSRAAIAELARSSTISVRDLSAKYEDILFQARPTWLASPYLVPQVVPRGRHFDVVIVADGGRLPTAAALPAIARARQAVVIGDAADYSERDAPMLLADMLEIVPRLELRRDARPAGSVLRAFAQRRFVSQDVLSVPSPSQPEPDRLVLVENGRGPVPSGTQAVESTEAELRRVTDLVIDHARTRPERSLAVLTLTEEHAHRVMERVLQTVAVVPDLREFFDASTTEYFTVLPAAHAGGVVRDDVILSLGYGKTPHGRLLHRFGPISQPGGRQALATVLTRARGRTSVVSCFGAEDLDPERLRTEGARDLRAMLTVLSGGPDDDLEALAAEVESLAQSEDDTPTTRQGTSEAGTSEETVSQEIDAQIEEALAEESATADGEVESETEVESDKVDPEGDDARDAGETASGGDAQSWAAETEDGDDGREDIDRVGAGPGDSEPEDSAPDGVAPETPGPDETPSPEPEGEPVSPDPADATDAVDAALDANALVNDLADRLWRLGLVVETDFGPTEDRIDLVLGHRELPGRFLVAVDTDGARYDATGSQRERDRLRAERLEAAGWATERVWSWALFIDPDGEAERIQRSVDRALMLSRSEDDPASPTGVGTVRHRLPRPQIPAGQPLSFYASEDLDEVVEYICSDGRARLEDQLATEVRSFLGFTQRSVLLDVSVSSAIRRFQERQ